MPKKAISGQFGSASCVPPRASETVELGEGTPPERHADELGEALEIRPAEGRSGLREKGTIPSDELILDETSPSLHPDDGPQLLPGEDPWRAEGWVAADGRVVSSQLSAVTSAVGQQGEEPAHGHACQECEGCLD